eukprot:CAMPEP_0178984854 /NCGR_PEP_ID=MMETSP0795-20121207/1840_1 /TAXON_ID=88552 /ORGANISM="Amoebophrya sp., Strain Ameob2" /LENGTH=3059 /DNA_ID=CAMNT_0020675771 /DNA_START=510 /DNA_END=9689 /DNA_ORIENTATION=-
MVSSSSRLDSKIRSVGQHDLDLGNFRLNFGAWGWIVFYIFALLGVLFPLLLRFVLLRDRFLAPDQSRHRVLISEDVLEIGRAPGTVRKRALFQRGYLTTHVGRFMYYSMQTLLYYMVLVMLLANAGRYIKRTHMRGYLYDFWGLAGEGAEGEERAKAGDGAVDDLDNKEEEEGNRTPLDAEVEYNFHLVFILVWLFLFGGILLFLSYKAELYNWCMKEVALEDAEFVAMEEQIREVPLAEEDTGFGNAAQETRGRTKKEAQTEAVEEALPVARLSGTANDATSETFSAVAPVVEPRQRSSVISQLSDGSRTTTATVATTTTTSAGGSSPSTETRSIIEASILTFATEDADDEDDDDNAESRDSASGAGRGSRRTSTSRIKGKVPRKEPTLVILEDGADVDEFLAENADELDDEGKIELAARLRARAKQTRTSSHQQFLRDLRRRVQTSVRSSVKNSQASTRAGAVEQLPGPRGGPSSPESSNARRNIRFDLNPIVEQVNVSDTDSEAATDLEDAQPPSGRHAPGTRLVSSSSTRNSDGERRHRTGILVGVKVLENCYVENTAHGRFLLFQCQKLQYASGDADHNPTASGAFIPPRNEILEAPLSTLLAKRDDPMTAHQIERDRTFRGLNSIEIALPSLLQWIAAELILVMNLWQIFRNVAVGYHDGVAFVAIPVFLFLLQVFLIARAKQTALQQIEEAADIAQISLRVYRAGESEPQMQLEDLRSQLQASKAKEGGLSEVERRESGGAEEVVGASTQDEQSTIDKSNQAQVQVAPGRDTHEPRWMVVNSCQLVPGDVFEVPDNCAMPCDAVLLDGYALINEADLTGEPMPVSKFPIEVEMGKGKDGKLDLAKHGKKNYLYCGTKVLQSVGATSSSTKRVTKVRQTLERSNSKGAKSGAAARSNSKNLVHLEDEEAGEGDVEDEEADQSANAAFQAIGLVVNTGPATTKGEMIRRILYPTPVRYAFIEQLPWFLFVSVLVFATCFSIPAALTSNRPALQFVQSMFFETVRMATLIIAPQLFLGLLMCQTNAKNRLFLSPARVKTLEPERLLMAGEVKVQCLDKTGTITEDGLQLSGTMPVVKVDGEVQLGELNLFNVGGSEPSGAVQMKNADTFLGDVGASGPLFSNMLAAGEVAPSSTVRPSGAEAQQEEDSPSVVEDSGEEEQQLVFDKNDLFAVAMATCHTVTKGTGSMTGELYGNMVEAEMVRKILSRGMDFRANVGENTVDYYKYTGRAADVDRAAGTRAKSSLPGGNYDAPEENPATAPRSSAAETEVNFDEPGEEERLDELHEDSFYLRRYLLDGEGGGPHDEGREVVDPAPNKNAVLRTVRQFEFDQTVQLQSVCVDLLNGKKYLLTKGSYDSVSKIVKPDTLPTNASKTLKSLAMEGFYVLAFAYRDLTFDLTGATTTATTTTTSSAPSSPSDRDAFLTMPRSDLEREETFLGFVLFRNELKVDSVAAIRELKRGEIQPIMVTGDNIWTGLHIGEEAGLIPRGAVVLAADVEPGRVAPELSWQYVKKEQAEYLPAWIDLLTSGKTLDYHAKLLYYGAEIMNASPPGSIIEEARQSQAAARRGSESSTLSGGTSRAADGAARRRASGEDLSSVRALRLGPVRNFVLSGHRKFPHEGKRWSKDVERPTLQFEGPGVEDAGDGYWIAGDGQDHFSRGFTQAASRALRRMKTAEQKLRLASCTVVKGRNANANTRTTDQTLGSAPSASSLVQLDGDEGAAKKTISELLSGILLRGTGSDASKNAPPDADVSANTEEGRPMNGDEAAKHLGNLHLEQDPSGPPAFYFALSEAAVNFLQERDPELLARIQRRIAVYGKVSPSGKVQVVRSLQRLNYVVGMCGDGGNDCAALRAAHAGMALSEGDASIVAAFSTPRKSLFGVVELIRQGRCCLRASTSLVELQMVVGAVYAGIVIVHSHNDTYFSDVCKTGAEVFPFACIVTLASALPPLHRGLVDPWGRMLVRRWSSRIFKGRGAEEVNQRFRPSVDGRSLLPGEVEQEVVGGGQANAANVVENEEDISSDSDDGGAGGQDGNAGRNARNDPQRSSSRASPEDRASNADPAKSSKKPDRTSEGEGCCGGSCSRRENWKPRRFRDGRWRMLSRSRTSGNLFERSRVLTMLLLFAFLATMLGGLMKLLNHQAWFVPYNLYSLNLKNGMGPNPTQVTRFDSGGVPTSHVLNWVFLFSIFTGLVAVSRDGKWRQRVWCNPMVALPVSMLAVLFVWPYYFGNNCWNLSLRINVDNRFSWETSDATAWAFWRFFQVASNEVNSMEYWFSRPEDDDAFYHLPPRLALDDQYAGNHSDDDRASRAPGSTLLWSGEWRAVWEAEQMGRPRASEEERAEGNTTDANVDHESAEEEEEEEETGPAGAGVHSNFWYEDYSDTPSSPRSLEPDSHSSHRYRIEQLKKIMGRDDLGFDRAEPARRFLTELGGLDRALRPLREKLLAHFDAGTAVVEPGDNNSTSNASARVKPKSAFWPSANVELRVYHTNTRQKVLDVSDKAMGADAEEGGADGDGGADLGKGPVPVVPSSHDPVGVAVSLEHLMNDALVTGFAEKSGAGAREKSASRAAEVAPQEQGQGAEVRDRKSDLASFVCQELCAATWSFPGDDPDRFPEWFAGDVLRERFYCWYASVSLGWEGNNKTEQQYRAAPECLLLPRLDSEGRPVGPEQPGYVNRVLVPGSSFFPSQLQASIHTIVLDRDASGQPRVQHNYLDDVRTRDDHQLQLGGKREHKARHEIEQVNKATSGFLQEDEQNQIFEESPSDESCAASSDEGRICEGDDSDCDDSRSDPQYVVRGFRGRENSFLSLTSSSSSAENGAVAKPRFSFSPSRTRTRTTEVQAEGYAAKPAKGRDGAESMTPRSMRGAPSSSVSSFIAAAREEPSGASESGYITEFATLSRKERLSRARARASQTPAQREERIRTGGLILQKETASTPASARRYRTFYLNRHNFLSWYSLNWRNQIPENSTHSRWLQERFESAGFSFFELNRPLYYPRADFDPREEFHHWFPHAYAHYPSGFVPIFSLYLALNTLFISLLTCALFHLFLKVPPLWRFFHGTGS